ncbi:PilZ domain-containing protein [Candidatus Sumerlaeota bacterium]|nr:PilZ domain-containing protein [Candidatus Sumerlaeota bacterium]
MGQITEPSDVVAGGGPQPVGYGGGDRRRYPRYEYAIPVVVRVLIEEETFNPMMFLGKTCNVSTGGMMVEVPDFPETTYRQLVRSQRPVRVHAQLPDEKDECIFFGRIVWYDYRRIGPKPSCRIGVAFEQLHEKEETAVRKLVRVLSTDGQATS